MADDDDVYYYIRWRLKLEADKRAAFPTPPEILSAQTAPQSIAQSIWAKRGEYGDSMANECG